MTTALTLNLWHTQAPYDARMTVAREYVTRTRPDVVFLQEVEFSGAWNQTAAVLDASYHVAAAPSHEPDGRTEGVALASVAPLAEVRTVRLDTADDEPGRVVVIARTQEPRPWLLAVTHLAWRPRSEDLRTRQAEQVAEAFTRAAADWGIERGVLGLDANATSDRPALAALAGAGFVDVLAAGPLADRPTWTPVNPYVPADAVGGRIDYLLGWGTGPADDTAIVLDTAPYASDHFGVWARF